MRVWKDEKVVTGRELEMDILVVTGGHINAGFVRRYLQGKSFDRIIAADAGLLWCRRLNLIPTDILGDFDSLQERELLKIYQDMGIPVQTFPARKDYTDTHLALMFAAKLHPSRIVLLGATGTRYDHALANIGLLQWMSRQRIRCVLIDEHNEMEMLCGPEERAYDKKHQLPFFSLLAWGGDALGIDLEGFSYPLKNALLTTDISLGISNELVEETGRVRLKSGYLLVIRSSD